VLRRFETKNTIETTTSLHLRLLALSHRAEADRCGTCIKGLKCKNEFRDSTVKYPGENGSSSPSVRVTQLKLGANESFDAGGWLWLAPA